MVYINRGAELEKISSNLKKFEKFSNILKLPQFESDSRISGNNNNISTMDRISSMKSLHQSIKNKKNEDEKANSILFMTTDNIPMKNKLADVNENSMFKKSIKFLQASFPMQSEKKKGVGEVTPLTHR